MVGLSIVLEAHKGSTYNNKNNPKVINKATTIIMIKQQSSSQFPPPQPPQQQWNNPAGGGFLEQCLLCNKKLLPDKDIYMYKGDKAFCSVECRSRQIFMDEKESGNSNSFATSVHMSAESYLAATSTPSSSPSSSRSRSKGPRNRANIGEFGYRY